MSQATGMSEFNAGYMAGVTATRALFAREQPNLSLAGLTLDRDARTVRFAGKKSVALSKIHFTLLELLMTGRMVPYDRAIEAIWPFGEESENALALIQVHICKLRKKLPPGIISTRFGQGWLIYPEPRP